MPIVSPLFDLHTFVLLLSAALVAIGAGVLTYLSTTSFPQSLLVAGGTAAAALAWGNSLIKPGS